MSASPSFPSDELLAVKSNCKKFVSLTEYYKKQYNSMFDPLLKSWKMIEESEMEMTPIIEMAWKMSNDHPFYVPASSEYVGRKSVIREHVVPGRPYTNKKGEKKMTAERRELAHFDTEKIEGDFLGWVSDLGTLPIYYTIMLRIERNYFKWVGVGNTFRGCFELRSIEEVVAVRNALEGEPEPETKPIGLSERREQRKALKAGAGK